MKHSKIPLITWFMFLGILLWMTGCASRKIASTSVETVKDSISVKTTITPRDTILKVPENMATVSVSLEQLTSKPVVSKSNNLQASVKREGNQIIAECHQEELLMKVSLLEKEIEYYQKKETEKSQEVRVPVYETPWYLRPFIWLGVIALIVIAILVAKNFLKKTI